MLVLAALGFLGCASLREAATESTPDAPDASITTSKNGTEPQTTVKDDAGATFFPPPADAGLDAAPDPAPPPTCDGGLCAPELFADVTFADHIAIVEDTLYVGGLGIRRCPLTNCSAPTTVVPQEATREFVVAGGMVYWVTYYNTGLGACPVTGCTDAPAHPITNKTNVRGLVVEDLTLYFTTDDGLFSCPVENCSDATAVNLFGAQTEEPLTLGDNTIYWADDDGQVESFTIGGGGEVLGGSHAQDVWSDGTNVLWASGSHIAICRAPECDGVPMLLPTSVTPRMPISDGTNVYFIDSARYLARCPLTGCPAQGAEVIVDSGELNRIALTPPIINADYIYWPTNAGVYRLPTR